MSINLTSGEDEPPKQIACKVCFTTIDIENKRDHYVVRCESCNEATVSI